MNIRHSFHSIFGHSRQAGQSNRYWRFGATLVPLLLLGILSGGCEPYGAYSCTTYESGTVITADDLDRLNKSFPKHDLTRREIVHKFGTPQRHFPGPTDGQETLVYEGVRSYEEHGGADFIFHGDKIARSEYARVYFIISKDGKVMCTKNASDRFGDHPDEPSTLQYCNEQLQSELDAEKQRNVEDEDQYVKLQRQLNQQRVDDQDKLRLSDLVLKSVESQLAEARANPPQNTATAPNSDSASNSAQSGGSSAPHKPCCHPAPGQNHCGCGCEKDGENSGHQKSTQGQCSCGMSTQAGH